MHSNACTKSQNARIKCCQKQNYPSNICRDQKSKRISKGLGNVIEIGMTSSGLF